MLTHSISTTLLRTAALTVLLFLSVTAVGQRRPPRSVILAVDRFERAYMGKNKKALLFQTMVPTRNSYQLKRRYQWYRGYGPDESAQSRSSPILFATTAGSFVPTSYRITSVRQGNAPDRWIVEVREQGTYRNGEERFRVARTRYLTVVWYGGRRYISDYFARGKRGAFGFRVYPNEDQLTPLLS